MTHPNVPEPSVWEDIADELERVVDEIRALLVSEPAPCSFSLNIQPHTPDRVDRAQIKHRSETVDAVDAVGVALLGKEASTYPCGAGFHHGVDGFRGPVEVRIYQAVADPTAVDPVEELARLRAENEALRAKLDQPAKCGGNCTRKAGHLGEHTLLVDSKDDEPKCYVPNGFQAPEVIAERVAACAASHPSTPCRSAAE